MTGGRPILAEPRCLLKFKEAAARLGVSVSYLRASDCPKVRLPGQGPKGRDVVRIDPVALEAWVESWSTAVKARRAG